MKGQVDDDSSVSVKYLRELFKPSNFNEVISFKSKSFKSRSKQKYKHLSKLIDAFLFSKNRTFDLEFLQKIDYNESRTDVPGTKEPDKKIIFKKDAT